MKYSLSIHSAQSSHVQILLLTFALLTLLNALTLVASTYDEDQLVDQLSLPISNHLDEFDDRPRLWWSNNNANKKSPLQSKRLRKSPEDDRDLYGSESRRKVRWRRRRRKNHERKHEKESQRSRRRDPSSSRALYRQSRAITRAGKSMKVDDDVVEEREREEKKVRRRRERGDIMNHNHRPGPGRGNNKHHGHGPGPPTRRRRPNCPGPNCRRGGPGGMDKNNNEPYVNQEWEETMAGMNVSSDQIYIPQPNEEQMTLVTVTPHQPLGVNGHVNGPPSDDGYKYVNSEYEDTMAGMNIDPDQIYIPSESQGSTMASHSSPPPPTEATTPSTPQSGWFFSLLWLQISVVKLF